MTRQSPRRGFGSTALVTAEIGAGTRWHRIYRSHFPDPLGFGHAPSRFSDPRIELPPSERFGVVYLGSSLTVCFLETVLRDRGNGRLGEVPLPLAELAGLSCAEIEAAVPLLVADLRGDAPLRMGVPTDAVRAASHRLGQRWAGAIWSHDRAPDGIVYHSRLNEAENLALFDRATAKLRVASVRPLLQHRTELAEIIDRFALAIL
jgi:hypothetical protein